jgi:hypothetical protein
MQLTKNRFKKIISHNLSNVQTRKKYKKYKKIFNHSNTERKRHQFNLKNTTVKNY